MELKRITKDELYMRIVSDISMRSTCARRAVGAIALDENGLVLATGYNGTPCGVPHCIDTPCEGASAPSGTALDKCEAVHAEQNLLLQICDVNKIHTIYCTTEPCTHCSKMIANTRCKRVVYEESYPGTRHFGDIRYEKYPPEPIPEVLTCGNCDWFNSHANCPKFEHVSKYSIACENFNDDIPF